MAAEALATPRRAYPARRTASASTAATRVTRKRSAHGRRRRREARWSPACTLCAAVDVKDGTHALQAADHFGNQNSQPKGGGKGGHAKGSGKTRPGGPPAGPKKQYCRLFAKGSCAYGAKCRFLHELPLGDATRQQQQESAQAADDTANKTGRRAKARAAKAKATAQAKDTAEKSDERVYPLFKVSPGVSEVPVPSGKADASFATAVKRPGALSRLPVDQKQKVASPTPGYNAQTLLKCCGVEVVALLDYGATCWSIPEWLFAEIYENTMARCMQVSAHGAIASARFAKSEISVPTRNPCSGLRKVRPWLRSTT